jgi:hypothetical protein
MEPKARAEGPLRSVRERPDEGWDPEPVLATPPGLVRVGGVGVGFVTGVVTGVGVGVGVVVVGGGVPTLTTGMVGIPTGMWVIGNSGQPCRSRCLWCSSTLGVWVGSGVAVGPGCGLVVPCGVCGSRVPRGPCGSWVTGGLGSGWPIGGSGFGSPVGGGSFGPPVGGTGFGSPVGGTGFGSPVGGTGCGSRVGGGFGFGLGKRGEPAPGPCVSGCPDRDPEATPWRTTRLLRTGSIRAELGKLDAAGAKTSPTSDTAMAAPHLDRGWLGIVHQRSVTTLPKTDHGGLRLDRQLDLVRQR